MKVRLKRSSTLNKRPNPSVLEDGELALNYNSTSPGLFFKDSSGASVKLGPVHVGETAPNVSPGTGGQPGNSVGEGWLKPSTNELKIWSGTAWLDSSPAASTNALTLEGQGGSYYLNYNNLNNRPTIPPAYTLPAFTGDITTTAGNTVATLANTAVTPGVYGNANNVPVVTVDSKGRVTSVTTAVLTTTEIPAFTGDITTTAGSTVTSLSTTAVTPGTYGSATTSTLITVDSKGRLTSASTTPISLPQSAISFLVSDLSNKQPLDSDLTALSLLSTTGYAKRTGSGTWTAGPIPYSDITGTPDPAYILLEEDLHLYCSRTGSDTDAVGRGLSAGNPFLTLQKAILVSGRYKVVAPYRIHIHLANGNYPERTYVRALQKTDIIIEGNTSNPSLVSLTGTAANTYYFEDSQPGVYAPDWITLLVSAVNCTLKGVTVTGSVGTRDAITSQFGAQLFISNCRIGSSRNGIDVQPDGSVIVEGGNTFQGSFTNAFSNSGILTLRNTVLTLSSVSSSNSFFNLDSNSMTNIYDTDFVTSGSAPTGTEYRITQGSVLTYVAATTTGSYGTAATGITSSGGAAYAT